mgnify:CR=1 FL=1
MKYFGTNGIRGIANHGLDSVFSIAAGRAIAEVLGPGPIAIACDPRISSDMIGSAVKSGILSMGADVFDLGMVPTPALQLYVRNHTEVSGGVMITASHNPPEFNGIKCISADGTECSEEEESRIEKLIDEPADLPQWNCIGQCRRISDAGERYIDAIVSSVDAESIRSANLTVCLDCSNGAGCATAPEILKRLGVRVVSLNSDPQGFFPGHPSEPTKENLEDLMAMVVKTGADLGIAHDGDADRCVFVTDKGEYLDGNLALALFSQDILKRQNGGTVVTPVATSMVVDDVVISSGGTIIHTAVGSPTVARRMISSDAVFGGEENGGLIFAGHQYCRDGGYAAARMLQLIADSGPLSKLAAKLPKYTMIKKAVHCPDERKAIALGFIASCVRGDIDTTDGLRINLPEGWVIMRPSGTEPKFRVYAESRSPDVAERLSIEYTNILLDAIKNGRELQ